MRHRLLAYGWLWMFFLLLASYNWSFGTTIICTICVNQPVMRGLAARYAATSGGGRRLSKRRLSTTAQRETCSAIITMSSLRGLVRTLASSSCCGFCCFVLMLLVFDVFLHVLPISSLMFIMSCAKLRSRRCLQGRDCSSEDEQCTLRGGTRKSSLQLLVINMMILWY